MEPTTARARNDDASHVRPTAEELFQFLEIARLPRRRVWRRYRTLRRAEMGQTRALIGALHAEGVPLFRIALALRRSDCCVKRHWKEIRTRLSVDEIVAFIDVLESLSGSTVKKARRAVSHERPVRRPTRAEGDS